MTAEGPAPPAELGARLQRLLRAAVRITGAPWAEIALLDQPAPLARFPADAVVDLNPAFECAVVGPDGRPTGRFTLGDPGHALAPNLVEALGELCALAGVGIALELERAAREGERAVLAAELDHRVKNILAAVQSVANQSAKRAASLDGFLAAFTGRLKAMAAAHELLTATRWRGASLRNLAAAELGNLAPGQIRWEGEDIFLSPRSASTLALALHELAINALRHGALSTSRGEVRVRWASTPDGGFTLDWAEAGGPPPGPSETRGFGRSLLEEVTGRELNGSVDLDFGKAGLRARITAGPQAVGERELDAPSPTTPVASEGRSVAPARGPRDIRGLRVLVVEDAALLAWELDAGLTEAGAKVVGTAAAVDEAMTMMGAPLDAAILDCNLNGVSVRPVAEALAERGVPFLFATGYGDNQGAPEGFDAPIIRKPYEVSQIVAALSEIAGRAP